MHGDHRSNELCAGISVLFLKEGIVVRLRSLPLSVLNVILSVMWVHDGSHDRTSSTDLRLARVPSPTAAVD